MTLKEKGLESGGNKLSTLLCAIVPITVVLCAKHKFMVSLIYLVGLKMNEKKRK